MTAKVIESKIVGFKVKKDGEQAHPPLAVVNTRPDIDPLLVRIEERPDGALEAVSEKITYNTMDGRKKVYMIVSFLPVEGIIDGQPVIVERPIEFFFPAGQLSSEHQWITATMRNLSLAARGGYVTQALTDLRKVAWDKGPVRCGENSWGKPLYHDSEVAAIAWSIQQILHRRGFVDVDGNQVPAKVLSRVYARRTSCNHAEHDQVDAAGARPAAVPSHIGGIPAGECPSCGNELILLDGCPTCTTCGFSKCQ